MNYFALVLILAGLYLIDSGVKNRAPIGFLVALLSSDKPDLPATLEEFNGRWTEPLDQAGIAPASNTGSGSVGSPGLGTSNDPRNGRLSGSELATVSFAPGIRLAPAAASAIQDLNKEYRARFGRNISITDGYRSYAQQVVVKAAKGNLAATPGKSNHGLGLAVDLGGGINSFGTDQYNWMMQNAPRFGWVNPSWAQQGGSKPEAWHWEFIGGGKTV